MKINLINKQKGEEIGAIKLQFLPRKGETVLFKGKNLFVKDVIHNEDYIVLDVSEDIKTEKPKKLGEPNTY